MASNLVLFCSPMDGDIALLKVLIIQVSPSLNQRLDGLNLALCYSPMEGVRLY